MVKPPVQMILESPLHHPSARGIQKFARQGRSLGASQMMRQDYTSQADANQVAPRQSSLYCKPAARQHVQQPALSYHGIDDKRYQRGTTLLGASWIVDPDNKTRKLS
ncbi:unnamed protein product [Peronospora belbahrii]|uniref:Uncharacterized protein n=1 Tax=Peronospora belbahrii TaxID=622444 RepID=A0AAU9KYB9_9STRA|nr:unnamed protein product [Peronospora belbahrii]